MDKLLNLIGNVLFSRLKIITVGLQNFVLGLVGLQS
jgi:hypothetical protein